MAAPETTTESATHRGIGVETLTAAHSFCSTEFTWSSCAAARSPAIGILIQESRRVGFVCIVSPPVVVITTTACLRVQCTIRVSSASSGPFTEGKVTTTIDRVAVTGTFIKACLACVSSHPPRSTVSIMNEFILAHLVGCVTTPMVIIRTTSCLGVDGTICASITPSGSFTEGKVPAGFHCSTMSMTSIYVCLVCVSAKPPRSAVTLMSHHVWRAPGSVCGHRRRLMMLSDSGAQSALHQ